MKMADAAKIKANVYLVDADILKRIADQTLAKAEKKRAEAMSPSSTKKNGSADENVEESQIQ